MEHPTFGRCEICSAIEFVQALIEPPSSLGDAGYGKSIEMAASLLAWVQAEHAEWIAEIIKEKTSLISENLRLKEATTESRIGVVFKDDAPYCLCNLNYLTPIEEGRSWKCSACGLDVSRPSQQQDGSGPPRLKA